MLELGGLPNRVGVILTDFALYGEEVEKDVGLLDHFHVEGRTEGVFDNPVIQYPA